MAPRIQKLFTKEDEKFLRDNCERMTNVELGKVLGRTPNSVQHKMSQLGVTRAKSWNEDLNNPEKHMGIKHVFKYFDFKQEQLLSGFSRKMREIKHGFTEKEDNREGSV